MARFFITGVAGFIGSTIARSLLEQEHEVRGIDNLSTGTLSNLIGVPSISFEQADIVTDAPRLPRMMSNVDYVLHLAADVSVPKSVADPVGTNRTNVEGMLNVLIAARDMNVKRFVFSSSAAIYGSTGSAPNQIDTPPSFPLSPYGIQKLTGEYYVKSICRSSALQGISLRYFNVFGARQSATSPYSGVIAQFITKMLKGETPTIYGDGGNTRDFTHVSNIVRANMLACECPLLDGKTFNIATGDGITIRGLYNMIADIIGFKEEPIFAPIREGDIRHSAADISKSSRMKYEPPFLPLREGLEDTIAWYRSQL